jgi:hypothetical protein
MAGKKVIKISLDILADVLKGNVRPAKSNVPSDIVIRDVRFDGFFESADLLCESTEWALGSANDPCPLFEVQFERVNPHIYIGNTIGSRCTSCGMPEAHPVHVMAKEVVDQKIGEKQE